jgi:hypothetical protein
VTPLTAQASWLSNKQVRQVIRQRGRKRVVRGDDAAQYSAHGDGITHVDDVPIVDGLAGTLKLAEMLLELRYSWSFRKAGTVWTARGPSRNGPTTCGRSIGSIGYSITSRTAQRRSRRAVRLT